MPVLDEYALDFLDPEEQRLVKEMLRAVVEHPDIYSNGFSVSRRRDGLYEYHLGNNQRSGPFKNRQTLPRNITDTLVYHKIAGRKINPQWTDNTRSFTEDILAWYREYGGPEPDEIRKKIGRYLRGQLINGMTPCIDPAQVAEAIQITPQRVSDQLHVLGTAGLLNRETAELGTDAAIWSFTGEGILWAEGGYPPISQRSMTTVNVFVDLKVEVQAIIERARDTEIPPERLLEFEGLLRRVQEELEKPAGQGNFQRVADLLGFVSDSLALSTLVIPFLSEHLNKLQTFSEVVRSIPTS